MGQIFAIVRNTLLETLRQPVYALVMVISCFLIAIAPALSAHIYTFGAGSGLEKPAERMIADLGLATMLLSGLILAVFATSSVISREIQNKTALTVLSKRVSRTAFIFGKYLGVAGAIGLAALVNTIWILLTLRIGAVVAVGDPMDYGILAAMIVTPVVSVLIATGRNYFKGRAWVGSFTFSFIAAAILWAGVFALFDKNYDFAAIPQAHETDTGHAETYQVKEGAGKTYDWDVAKAGLLTLEAVLLIAGVSVAASTRLETGGNFIVSSVVFTGGLTSEYFYGLALSGNWPRPVLALVDLWRTLVPNLQTFWMSDALTRERPIPWVYVHTASLYGLCYILGMLFLAAFLFQKREIS